MSLLVVGAGPAGIAAALQARELGAEVTLLEADQAGGTSLNRGPAPVRTLARAARLMRDWCWWARFGLEGDAPTPNLPALLANSARVARYARDKKDLAGHLRHQGIDLIEGLGPVCFADPHIGEYSAEIVQMVAACMAANMHIEQIAELQLAYPTFTEAVSMAAQKVCRRLGIGRFPQVWSYLGSAD